MRNRYFLGLKFFRQYGVGRYILDFFCPECRLSVEIDGGQHADAAERQYDERRTRFLSEQGIDVIRFWNCDVFENLP